MAKNIVVYLLEGDGTVPKYIVDGGYFINENDEMVGLTINDAKRYMPKDVVKITKNQLIARCKALMRHPESKLPFSQEDAEVYVQKLLDSMGMSSYV